MERRLNLSALYSSEHVDTEGMTGVVECESSAKYEKTVCLVDRT
jgi:hypothetical protein